MVFNMFRGLSRLLSRKSVKTVVPPVVGFASAESHKQIENAELSHDELPELNSVFISGHPQGISVRWQFAGKSEVSAIIRTHQIDVNRLRREIAGSGGFYLAGGIGGVNCYYTDTTNSIINNGCTLPTLLTHMERAGVVRREGYQLFLCDGVTLI